jgi:hypothetical protein
VTVVLIIRQKNEVTDIYAVWPVETWSTTGAGRTMAFPPSYPACVRLLRYSEPTHESANSV